MDDLQHRWAEVVQAGACVDKQVCGDNAIEGTEECDGGSTLNDDGCSSQCTLTLLAAGPVTAVVPNSGLLDSLNGAFTFESWVAPEYISATNTVGILNEKCSDSEYSYEFGITINDDGNGGRLYLDLPDGQVRQSNVQVQPGSWSHVAVTMDSISTEFWLNGALVGTAAGGVPGQSDCLV